MLIGDGLLVSISHGECSDGLSPRNLSYTQLIHSWRLDGKGSALAMTSEPDVPPPPKVWFSKATAVDVRRAKRLQSNPWNPSRNYLVRVPAMDIRTTVYEHTSYALALYERSLLPLYGGRPWKVIVKITDDGEQSPYFVFHEGQLELACWPYLVEKIPCPTTRSFPGQPQFPTIDTVSLEYVENEPIHSDDVDNDNYLDFEEDSPLDEEGRLLVLDMLQRRNDVHELCQMAVQQKSRVPLPTVTIKWISPLRETFSSRKQAYEAARVLCCKNVQIQKVFHGISANGKPMLPNPPIKKAVLDAGAVLFERDGLWVVGQEEEWRQVSHINSTIIKGKDASIDESIAVTSGTSTRRLTGLVYYLQCNRREYQQKRQYELMKSIKSGGFAVDVIECCPTTMISPNAVTQPTKLSAFPIVVTPPVQMRVPPRTNIVNEEKKDDCLHSSSQHDESNMENSHDILRHTHTPNSTIENVANISTCTPQKPTSSNTNNVKVSFTVREAEIELRSVWKSLSVTERQEWEDKARRLVEQETDSKYHNSSSPTVVKSSRIEYSPGPSVNWCLNEEQVKLCYNAGVNHFNQIMQTVKIRDLTRELEAGFDLLRERGRGRYDMELPVFDQKEFDFLNDPKRTPWMPVVKALLGNDAVLIHKGIFLSLPGAETQNYHQDGLHLSTQYQRPCHALNVFVPLVDLTTQGTEFCLGSHILGQEDYVRKFVVTPRVRAGTPVIFDYRLGHRGLSNSSNSIRPVVYCTYAAGDNGKEFRDSVNFSRKRYRRIGDLVQEAPSREERAKKRGRANA